MLPPPTTTQSSWPCFASAISRARREVVSGSIPNAPSPINASPDSFRRIRLKRGRGMGFSVRSARETAKVAHLNKGAPPCQASLGVGRFGLADSGRGGDFGGEIAFLLLDAFAELEADIGIEGDRAADALGLGGDDV